MKNGKHENHDFYAAIVKQTKTTPNSPRQQLTITALPEQNKSKMARLSARRHPPPKHSISLARVA